MKKTILSVIFAVCLTGMAKAQNIQLHYDLGRALYNSLEGRPWVTTTVEMFKPDRWGSTFFFVDMDYTDKGVASAYWEIGRELNFWGGPFSAHVEYNGGLNYINNAFLGGATYTWNSTDFTRGFTLSAMYKYIPKNEKPHNFQITGTWHVDFAGGRYSFSGFADFWRERHTDTDGNRHDWIFLSEPQLWVNLDKFRHVSDDLHLSVGTEWELSTHFATRNGFYFIPTLAMKWTF